MGFLGLRSEASRQAGKRHIDVGVMYIFQIGIEPAITVRTIAAFEILDPGDLQIAPKIKRRCLGGEGTHDRSIE